MTRRLADGERRRNPCKHKFARKAVTIGQWFCTLSEKMCDINCSSRGINREKRDSD